jgi:YaiO family outer membrane protein
MDDDARTMYGIILSWERQFDRARQELQGVIANNPRNLDARLALVRVELWSGRVREAERLANESLGTFPGNSELMALRNQARTNLQRSQVSVGSNYDDYEEAWKEAFVELKAGTRMGTILGRVSHAQRFGRDDDQLEVEAYPRVGRRGYAFLSAGWAPDAILYPETRLGAEIYRSFAKGFEASIGARRLDFANAGATNVYTASLSKYIRDWLVGARIYDSEADTAVQVMARRYFGARGEYIGLRFGRGSTRDDVRSAVDLQSLEVREVALETLFTVTPRSVINLRGGLGRGRGKDRYSVSAALGWRF